MGFNDAPGSKKVDDVEKAHEMAIAGNKLETDAAFVRQRAKLIDEMMEEIRNRHELEDQEEEERKKGKDIPPNEIPRDYYDELSKKYAIKLEQLLHPSSLTESQILAGLSEKQLDYLTRPFDAGRRHYSGYNRRHDGNIDTYIPDGDRAAELSEHAHQREDVAQILHEHPEYVFANGEKPTIDSVIEKRNFYNHFEKYLDSFYKLLRLAYEASGLEFDDIFDERSLLSNKGDRKVLALKDEIRSIAQEFIMYQKAQKDYQILFENGPFTPETRRQFLIEFAWEYINTFRDIQSETRDEVGVNARELLGIKNLDDRGTNQTAA